MATTSERRRAVRSEDTGSELRSDDNAALAALLDSVDCGVLLFGARGELRAANDRFAEILHLAPARLREFANFEELAGHLAQQFSDPQGVAMHWRKRFEATEGALDELELVHPEHKLLERITRPVRGSLGERHGWIEIYRDVGNRSSIHTDRMVALGRLVSGVAHELNNPLTSILGFAQLILRRGGDPERDTGAQQILSEVERASRIVRNLLLFARETEPERARVNLNDIVKSTLALRAHELRRRRISVRLDLDAHLPPTAADAMRLQQVLLNLLGNAEQAIESHPRQNRKPGSPHSQAGPIGPLGPIGPIGRIWVRTRHLSPQRVVMEVIDDGPGIPSEIVARIFDPFFTTKPPGMGTGLGLSIVFGIVQDHGGRISVENRRTGGAAFRIELPIGTAPETLETVDHPGATGAVHGRPNADCPNNSSLAASPQRESLAMPAGAQERILVVEDEPTVARLIADILDEEGYVVHTVLDSLAALDLICAQEYALVIFDLRMPRLDGRGFYRELVRRRSSLQTRIVFVTGDTLTPHASHFLKQSGAAFLAKPFLVEELKNTVAHALATARNPEVDSVATPVQARRPRQGALLQESRVLMDHDVNILLVCADSTLTRQYFSELEQSGAKRRLLLAVSVAEARLAFGRHAPSVILLDASAQAGDSDTSFESAVSMLIEDAPVVLVAIPKQQRTLAYLIAAGAVDFVAREGNFVPVAAALVERRLRLAIQEATTTPLRGPRPTEEFGEMLRHEVNNPLTGILGNAELLLARHDPLPAAAIVRVETIAALAVRLRETVRRLSQACGKEKTAKKRHASEISPRPARSRQQARPLAARASSGGPVPVPFRAHEPVEE